MLASAAGGRAHVGILCGLTGLSRGSIGRHRRDLRLRGLVHDRPEGRHVWYHCDPTRVRLHPTPKGYALTLTHPSGVELTLGVPTGRAAIAAEANHSRSTDDRQNDASAGPAPALPP